MDDNLQNEQFNKKIKKSFTKRKCDPTVCIGKKRLLLKIFITWNFVRFI